MSFDVLPISGALMGACLLFERQNAAHPLPSLLGSVSPSRTLKLCVVVAGVMSRLAKSEAFDLQLKLLLIGDSGACAFGLSRHRPPRLVSLALPHARRCW